MSHAPPLSSTAAKAHEQEIAHRFLLLLWITMCLAAVGLGLLTAALICFVPPNRIDEAFLSRFTVAAYYFYPAQPAKSLAYELGALLAPLFIWGSYILSQVLVQRIDPRHLPLATRLAVGATWLIFLWCVSPVIYCPNPPYPDLPPGRLLFEWYWNAHPLPLWVSLLEISLALALCFFLWKRQTSRRLLNVIFGIFVLFWMLMLPINFYSPADFNDELRYTYHFNVLTDALSQVVNGHHVLVQFPHMYGGYIEVLGPLLALFPRRIETLMAVFPLINAVAILALLTTARLIILHPLFLFLTGASILSIEYIPPSYDHYYSYSSVRLLFPALGLLASAFYFRWPDRFKYGFVSILAAVATIWNLDSGIALWLSWTATVLVVGLSDGGWLRGGRNFLAQLGSLVIAWTAFSSYLRLASGQWPDFQMLVVFPKLVLSSGYVCLPMTFPDAWIIDVLVYGAALVIALAFHLKRTPSWRINFSLMIGLLGIGLFQYYMGRSAVSNLVTVSYPVLLLIGMLLNGTLSMISLGRLPRIAWAVVLPAALIISWWALMLPMAFPSLLKQSAFTLQKLRSPTSNSLETNAAFVAAHTIPKEGVYLLSDQSGVYYYLSDTVRPIQLPGTIELLLKEDMDSLIAAIHRESFSKLFVDQNFFAIQMYRPEIYGRLREEITLHYQPQSTSPTGQVILYLPN